MTDRAQNLLQDLRDIHYPSPISWWPLAPGWYVLAVAVLVSAFVLWRWLQTRRRLKQWRQKVFARFDDLERGIQHRDRKTSVMALSVFLKQVALGVGDRHHVAGLNGEPWLQFLDQTGATQEFTTGIGRLLLTAPYQPNIDNDVTPLFVLAKAWLQKQLVNDFSKGK